MGEAGANGTLGSCHKIHMHTEFVFLEMVHLITIVTLFG